MVTNERLRGLFVITFFYNVFGWPTLSLVPVIGGDVLGLRSDLIGILTSADGAGTLAGAMLIGWLARPHWFGRLYVGGCALFSAMMALVALTDTFMLAGGALVLVGLGGAGFSVMQSTLVFLATPLPLRGAVLGMLTVCIGVAPLGLVLVGAVAQVVGASAAMFAFSVCGVLAIGSTAAIWRPLWRSDWVPRPSLAADA